jgi:class 3 adenylate cyclase
MDELPARGDRAGGPGERVLATVLFTDIVDSTATLARVGDRAWRELLLEHNTRMRQVIATFRGRELATTGDGFLVVFDGATNAVRCGAEMVRTALALGVQIRVGIHTGEVEIIDDNARGLAVHAAARVMAVAGADEVVVSETTRDLVEGSGLSFDDAGRHALKGLSGERQLYRLVPARGRLAGGEVALDRRADLRDQRFPVGRCDRLQLDHVAHERQPDEVAGGK